MSFVEGGQLDRFAEHAVTERIRDGLLDLGWVLRDPHTGALSGAAPEHYVPITLTAGPIDADKTIEKNTLVVEFETTDAVSWEVGQDDEIEDAHVGYADLYAQDVSVGRHIAGDVRGILRGRMPSIGLTSPVVDIYNYNMATPEMLCYGLLSGVRLERAQAFSRPWRSGFFSVQFVLTMSTETYAIP